MHRILISIILLLTSFSLFGQSRQIKVIKEYTTNNINDTLGWLHSIKEYDNAGNLLKEITYNCGDNSFAYKTEYIYDEKGELAKTLSYSKGDTTLDELVVYSFERNGSGQLTRKEFGTMSNRFDRLLSSTQIITYKYDKGGNLINESTEVTTPANKKSHYIVKYHYNDSNQIIKKEYSGFYWTGSDLYQYDEKGREIKYVFEGTGKGGWEPKEWVKEYDKIGNLIKQTTCPFNKTDRCCTTSFNYDSLGRVTKEMYSCLGRFSLTTKEFRYNENGNLSDEIEFNDKGEVIFRRYFVYNYF